MERRRVLFLTGTRADYGKMKPLMKALNKMPEFDVYVFVCGMHLLETFGGTYGEVLKGRYRHIHVAYGLMQTADTSINLGNTISYLAGYVKNVKPDMIVIHGDRPEALAGSVVGAFNNIIVAHIEGGELSGTIDESIRHAVSKLAHVHFVSTEEARRRLIQLGEEPSRIYVIGSPDIDVMKSDALPSLRAVKGRYAIKFDNYAILIYHPVTTEYNITGLHVKTVVDAVIESKRNYAVIFPNNDLGSEIILNEYKRFDNNSNFRVIKSVRFEYFLALLKNADFMIGNSSAGIRESGIYGVPAIDIGTRQSGRYSLQAVKNVQHVDENVDEILSAIENSKNFRTSSFVFGDGNSTEKFINIVNKPDFWNIALQKRFINLLQDNL